MRWRRREGWYLPTKVIGLLLTPCTDAQGTCRMSMTTISAWAQNVGLCRLNATFATDKLKGYLDAKSKQ